VRRLLMRWLAVGCAFLSLQFCFVALVRGDFGPGALFGLGCWLLIFWEQGVARD